MIREDQHGRLLAPEPPGLLRELAAGAIDRLVYLDELVAGVL
jgi:hypothetical protein